MELSELFDKLSEKITNRALSYSIIAKLQDGKLLLEKGEDQIALRLLDEASSGITTIKEFQKKRKQLDNSMIKGAATSPQSQRNKRPSSSYEASKDNRDDIKRRASTAIVLSPENTPHLNAHAHQQQQQHQIHHHNSHQFHSQHQAVQFQHIQQRHPQRHQQQQQQQHHHHHQHHQHSNQTHSPFSASHVHNNAIPSGFIPHSDPQDTLLYLSTLSQSSHGTNGFVAPSDTLNTTGIMHHSQDQTFNSFVAYLNEHDPFRAMEKNPGEIMSTRSSPSRAQSLGPRPSVTSTNGISHSTLAELDLASSLVDSLNDPDLHLPVDIDSFKFSFPLHDMQHSASNPVNPTEALETYTHNYMLENSTAPVPNTERKIGAKTVISMNGSNLVAKASGSRQNAKIRPNPTNGTGTAKSGAGANSKIDSKLVFRLDELFPEFLQSVCSNLTATDPKGEKIHQTQMAKKLQKFTETNSFRPFRFRIQPFINAFRDWIISKAGLTEELLNSRDFRQYLHQHKYISRFNENGGKAKSKGQRVWNVEAKKLSDGNWEFKEFTCKIVGIPPPIAFVGSKFKWSPTVWDPQVQTPNATFSSPWLPAWLKWENNAIVGYPSADSRDCDVLIIANYEQGNQAIQLEKYVNIKVSEMAESSDIGKVLQTDLEVLESAFLTTNVMEDTKNTVGPQASAIPTATSSTVT
ncbi:hypothetical protein H4219_002754 [Mycoemilia scoparia]|uniref:Uncharacterized protein n=1 Tax=Mycoemilia scoparia TaxID=417184 RepID=A0A9W8A4Q6_9FUNG|nr:hypothetical protein H4219_002754 [Mycoemilia scoparia]